MSRSSRKTPICGITTAASEKQDKRHGNRKERRANRIRLGADKEPIHRHEVSNPWMMSKDGKRCFDRQLHPELMRK